MPTNDTMLPLFGYTMDDEDSRGKALRAAKDKSIPFSLSCHGCDAGDGFDDVGAACAEGWRRIAYEPDGLSWNFIGDCPDCILKGTP